MSSLDTLYAKLCRELAQSERSAVVHSRREARRLRDTPPARALRAVGAHAQAATPRFASVCGERRPVGLFAGRRLGELFSALRHALFGRKVDIERSYRRTLLGFHDGLSVVRLLRDVAEREGKLDMVTFCADWLETRVPLVEAAERELHWFAEPRDAIRSGLRVAFETSRE